MIPSSSPNKGTKTDGVWADAAGQIRIDGKGNRFVNEYAERDVIIRASFRLDKAVFYIIHAGRGNPNKPDIRFTGAEYNAAGMEGKTIAEMVESGNVR